MKTSFTIAALFGLAYAGPKGHRPSGNGVGSAANNRFNAYQARFGKHYNSEAEYNERMGRFNNNAAMVDATNQRAHAADDLRLELNMFADMSNEEFQGWLGLAPGIEHRAAGWGRRQGGLGHGGHHKGGHRMLSHAAVTVDHSKDGFMHAVKDQGGCGSCWAFASNTTLEGTVAKKNGSAPVRLSEQHLVDCTLRDNDYNYSLFNKDYGLWGCGGGWMSVAWDFQKEQGIMLDADYPYTSGDTGTETQCGHDTTKTIGNVAYYQQIRGSSPSDQIAQMKAKTMEQPLSIALDAGTGAFQFYKSGVVKAGDGCGTQLNHAVVIVGFTEAGDGDDTDPTPDPEPEPVGDCTVHKWWHTCEPAAGRRLATDEQGLTNYWKIQNSWGEWWGDGGFIRLEITEGTGVCAMNEVVEFVEMA